VYYDIRVKAKNVVGAGQESLSIRIVAGIAPEPPSVLQIIAQSSTSITVGWLAVTGTATGGTPITSYQVYWKSSTDFTYTLAG
jgi:hypothetical protein